MEQLPIIDPHHHLWDLERNRYPWLQNRPLPPSVAGDLAPIARSYRIEDYQADIRAYNVVKSVHVECGWDPANPVGETAWLQSVADAHGFPHGIVARAPLDAPDIGRLLEAHAAFRNTRGIRHTVVLCFEMGREILTNRTHKCGDAAGEGRGMMTTYVPDPAAELLAASNCNAFACILADPPWQFINRTGKMAPEHKRLSRYGTMDMAAISALPVAKISAATSHLYLWVPNALLPEGLRVMEAWGFSYKSNLVWHKIRKDGGSDGRGVGFYFRNVTELVLFGVKGRNARTLKPGRTQVNYLGTRKREHSRKPDELYSIIEACSPGPRIELFARGVRPGWTVWGDQAAEDYEPTWKTYRHNSAAERKRNPVLPFAAE